MLYKKRFVDVVCRCSLDGKIKPTRLIWDDDTYYDVDKVLEVKKAASMNAGGLAIRYECVIMGKKKLLFFDWTCDKWFVEEKI